VPSTLVTAYSKFHPQQPPLYVNQNISSSLPAAPGSPSSPSSSSSSLPSAAANVVCPVWLLFCYGSRQKTPEYRWYIHVLLSKRPAILVHVIRHGIEPIIHPILPNPRYNTKLTCCSRLPFVSIIIIAAISSSSGIHAPV
jgi:hypothetical protein